MAFALFCVTTNCLCASISASSPALSIGTSVLQISDDSSSSKLGLIVTDRKQTILKQIQPAKVAFAFKGVSEQILSAGYDVAAQVSNTIIVANATLSLLNCRVLVTDQWEIVGRESLARFELHRAITVLANPPDSNLLGVASHLLFDLATTTASTKVSDLQVFAPALWYGNNSMLVGEGSIGSNKNLTNYFIRTDRFAAPLFSVLTPPKTSPNGDTIRGRATLFSLDQGFQTVVADNASALLVDDRLGYGAIGLHAPAGAEIYLLGVAIHSFISLYIFSNILKHVCVQMSCLFLYI